MHTFQNSVTIARPVGEESLQITVFQPPTQRCRAGTYIGPATANRPAGGTQRLGEHNAVVCMLL
jgi:hypothetical protein